MKADTVCRALPHHDFILYRSPRGNRGGSQTWKLMNFNGELVNDFGRDEPSDDELEAVAVAAKQAGF